MIKLTDDIAEWAKRDNATTLELHQKTKFGQLYLFYSQQHCQLI